MATKYIIRGRTYTLVNFLPVGESFIKMRAKVLNSKKEEFTLVKTLNKYTLYNNKDREVLTTSSIREVIR